MIIRLIKIQFIILLVFYGSTQKLNGQNNSLSAGDIYQNSMGSISFSLAQIDYANYTSSAGSVMEGLQIPFDIITLGENKNLMDLNIIVYPNPTSSTINLSVLNPVIKYLDIELVDNTGKTINNYCLNNENTFAISLNNLPPSVYYLNVYSLNKELYKNFKIVKN